MTGHTMFVKKIIYLLFFIFVCYSTNVSANAKKAKNVKAKEVKEAKKEEPINNMEYFLTLSVYPQDKGELDVYLMGYPQQQRGEQLTTLPMTLSYGMTDSWLIYITPTPLAIHTSDEDRFNSGYGDTDIGTQYSFLYIHHTPNHAALAFNLHLPTGYINRGLTDGFIRYEPSVLYAHDFVHPTWTFQVFSQTGFSFVQRAKHHSNPQDDNPAAHSFICNVGADIRTLTTNYSLELNLKYNGWNHNGNENILYATPGIYQQIKKSVKIGIGVPIGLTHDSDKYQVLMILEVDFVPKKSSSSESSKKNNGSKAKEVKKSKGAKTKKVKRDNYNG
jgi:hypothetical protein